jgi:hypothetical protein
MIKSPPNASIGLTPKWKIPFPTFHASLARPLKPLLFDDDPDGLIIFGDSSAIYFAQVSTGSGVYGKLPTIKATTYIHGWALDAGSLYVLDGVDLTKWDLGEAAKRHTVQLVAEPDATTARTALGELKKAIQSAEWAAFLEQAEDEHDRLATPPADFVKMLEDLRAMVGSANTSAAARQKIAELRSKLAEKRKAAAPWCFSAPLVRQGSLQEPTTAVLIMQGNGMLYACDKELGPFRKNNWDNTQAELHLALLDDRTSSAPKRLAFVADSTLHVIDPVGLLPKGHWSPVTAPEKGTTHSLTAANGQFLWSTESGVYALKPDESTLQLIFQTGPPWNARQVGRLGVPQTNYNPQPDPNELFESMNVHGWIAQRADKTVPLSDGMAAQLVLSDENGKYVAPPKGTTHVLYGPFGGGTHTWGEVSGHESLPLVLLSDSNAASMLCKYPLPNGLIQVVPQWVIAPWLSSLTRDSPADVALSQPWPTPAVRPLSKPQPNMLKYLHDSPATMAIREFELHVPEITTPSRNVADRELRYVFWWAIFDHPFPDPGVHLTLSGAEKALKVFYTDAQKLALRTQFAGQGTVWDFWGLDQGHVDNFDAAKPVPDFDPPWKWKTPPPSTLFHKPPPRWYDPWGYNRPGDFITQQPAATYLDPFCFNGQLHFPQRAITFGKFKGQQWAVFVDYDPAEESSEPEDVSAEPGILVVRADEDQKLTTVYVLSSKHLGVTYDVASHELRQEAQPFGTVTDQVLGTPGVFLNAGWWVASPEYPSVRLQKTAAQDPTKGNVRPWDTFVNTNKSKYGPTDGSTAWNIAECPLPADVLPSLVLFGHLLPPPH